jgi:hypothetical protein
MSKSKSTSDWRSETLARMRELILEAEPEIIEEQKWRKPSNGMVGVPVWSHNGIICTGETYKNAVKLTFAKGASLPDPSRLFNSSLEGNTRRAIDIHEGETINADAFRKLVQAAVALNGTPAKKVKLLSGGNPQIAKAYGDAPVQEFIANSTRSSLVPSPTCTKPSNGTRPSTASRKANGSSVSTASRSTSKSPSSAAPR